MKILIERTPQKITAAREIKEVKEGTPLCLRVFMAVAAYLFAPPSN